MSSAGPDGLFFRPLSSTCRIGAFSCGNVEIDKWFAKNARKSHDSFKSRVTTVRLEESGDPVGFYALGIALEDERFLERGKFAKIETRSVNRQFPALQFQWLAVRREHQNRGIGTVMIGRVIDVFIDAVENLGLPVMTLTAANSRVAAFYKRLGFDHYGGPGSMRMLLPADSALELRRFGTTDSEPT